MKSEERYMETKVYSFEIINCVVTAITIHEKSTFICGTLVLLYVCLFFEKQDKNRRLHLLLYSAKEHSFLAITAYVIVCTCPYVYGFMYVFARSSDLCLPITVASQSKA